MIFYLVNPEKICRSVVLAGPKIEFESHPIDFSIRLLVVTWVLTRCNFHPFPQVSYNHFSLSKLSLAKLWSSAKRNVSTRPAYLGAGDLSVEVTTAMQVSTPWSSRLCIEASLSRVRRWHLNEISRIRLYGVVESGVEPGTKAPIISQVSLRSAETNVLVRRLTCSLLNLSLNTRPNSVKHSSRRPFRFATKGSQIPVTLYVLAAVEYHVVSFYRRG
jgi:hypothetical protein